MADSDATSIYGTYTGAAWGASIVGGIIGDRWLGQYRSVLIGGIVIMLGHFSLVFPPLPFFYAGLALIVIGTGLLKPNVSTLVGSLYPQGDLRRDNGFSIFYMGINVGALLGPLVAGYLAQRVNWHIGFASRRRRDGNRSRSARPRQALLRAARRTRWPRRRARRRPRGRRAGAARAGAPSVLRAPSGGASPPSSCSSSSRILFLAGYEQAGSTLNLFADRYTRLEAFGFSFPSSWFQSVQPFFVDHAGADLRVDVDGARRQAAVDQRQVRARAVLHGYVVPGARSRRGHGPGRRRHPREPVVARARRTAISEFGEMCLYPVGMSAVTKLAPPRIVGLMMGVWFLSIAFGNKLAGWVAGFIETMPLPTLFGVMTAVLVVAGRRHVRCSIKPVVAPHRRAR